MILLKLQTFTKYSNEGVCDRVCLFLALGCNGVDTFTKNGNGGALGKVTINDREQLCRLL